MMKVRVFLADDHVIMRQGLRRIVQEQPDWEVTGEASNGRDAVRQILELQPDIAVIDINMPQLNGIEATAQVLRRLPVTRILILSMYSDEGYVLQALQAGARGYLLKDSADVDLIRAINAVMQGKSFFSPAVSKIMLDDYLRHLSERGITDRYESLSEREREIFQLIAEGHSNKEVAELLFISPSTVETHRGHIMEKLDVHSTAEVVLYAVRKGIIS